MSILLKDVLVEGRETSVYIEDNLISEIGVKLEADHVIDGVGMALLPGFVNLHTHAAMTLLKSYADDMALQEWLQIKIWPQESKLTPDDIYWGTKLACLEMIKSGTTCFNDMYFHMDQAARAVEEMGIRSFLSEGFIDMMDPDAGAERLKEIERINERIESIRCPRIKVALGPHAIYTVSEESLLSLKDMAERRGYLLHIHLSETEKEVKDCLEDHGLRPVEFLEKIGFLGENVIAAHSVWLNEKEIEILKKHHVKTAYNPISNMKLAVGSAMPLGAMKKAGIAIGLGTDGSASNNSLDMFQSMKFGSLLQKFCQNDPTELPAREMFDIATKGGAECLQLNSGGIEEGRLADLMLIDIKKLEFTPNHDIYSNLVYSANGHCVHTLICNGEIVMKNRRVRGEEELIEKARSVAEDLIGR